MLVVAHCCAERCSEECSTSAVQSQTSPAGKGRSRGKTPLSAMVRYVELPLCQYPPPLLAIAWPDSQVGSQLRRSHSKQVHQQLRHNRLQPALHQGSRQAPARGAPPPPRHANLAGNAGAGLPICPPCAKCRLSGAGPPQLGQPPISNCPKPPPVGAAGETPQVPGLNSAPTSSEPRHAALRIGRPRHAPRAMGSSAPA
jgi:hypothetical protein